MSTLRGIKFYNPFSCLAKRLLVLPMQFLSTSLLQKVLRRNHQPREPYWNVPLGKHIKMADTMPLPKQQIDATGFFCGCYKVVKARVHKELYNGVPGCCPNLILQSCGLVLEILGSFDGSC